MVVVFVGEAGSGTWLDITFRSPEAGDSSLAPPGEEGEGQVFTTFAFSFVPPVFFLKIEGIRTDEDRRLHPSGASPVPVVPLSWEGTN